MNRSLRNIIAMGIAAVLTLPAYSQNYRQTATTTSISRPENVPATSEPGYRLAPITVPLSPDESSPCSCWHRHLR